MKNVILIFVTLFLGISGVSAKSNNEFVEFLGLKIYNDCQGKDIQLNSNKDFPVSIQYGATTTKILSWEYSKEQTIGLIRELDSNDWGPFLSVGTFVSGSHGDKKTFVGFKAMICGDSQLDIDGNDYIWNGEKVEMPKETNVAVNNKGNLIQGSGNSNTQIQKAECRDSFLKGIIIGVVSGVLAELIFFILKKSIKRRRKK